jgi:signal transduction histidine kinase
MIISMKFSSLVNIFKTVVYLSLFVFLSSSYAQVMINQQLDEILLSEQVEIVKVSRSYNIEKSDFQKLDFKKNQNKSLSLGYNNNQIILKFNLTNSSDVDLERFLYLNSINGHLKLYYLNENHTLQYLTEGGTDIPKLKREHFGIFSAMKLKLPAGLSRTYFLTLTSRHNINTHLVLSSSEKLELSEEGKTSFLSFYAGGILLLVIYNVFVFLFLKDKVYIFYCLYALSFLSASLVVNGAFDNLFPNMFISFSHYLICFSSLSIATAALFTMYFLDIPKFLPSYKKVFYLIMGVSSFIFVSGLIPQFDQVAKLFGITIDILILLGLVFFIFVAIKLYSINKLSRFYLLSWAVVLVFVAMWFGMTFGVLKISLLTQNALPIGSMLEMLTLAIALAYKIQVLNDEKISALKKAKDKDRYERLVRVLSHDVANSLTVVSAYSKKLIKNQELDSVIKNQAEKIYQGTENIKNILQIVREQEVKVLKETSIDLAEVNVLDAILFSKLLHEEALQSKGIDLKINIPDSLTVRADRTCFINNILNNLISNSIKFSFPNSVIEIFSTESSDFTFVIIKDSGVGIKADLLHDIFYSNKTVTTTGTNQEAGHGLGSSLIREYMILFGGKIQVSSITKADNPTNHGTTIKLIFPTETGY